MESQVLYTHTEKEKLEEIPFAERTWAATPFHLLSEAVQGREQKLGMEFLLNPSNFKKTQSFSYHDLITGMAQTAQLLHGLGLDASDRIAVILPNIPELHISLWGGSLLCPVGLINPMLTTDQMTSSLQQIQPKVLITTGPYPGLDLWDKIEEVREEVSSIRFVLQVDLVAYLGKIKQWQARRILRSRGKAEPISGQQIGDFNASRQKFLSALPDTFPLLGAENEALLIVSDQGGDAFTIQAYTHRQICATLWGVQQALPQAVEGSYLWGESCTSLSACLLDGLLPMLNGQAIICAGPQGFASKGLSQNLGNICAFFHITRMRIGQGSALLLPDSQNLDLPSEWLLMEGWHSNSTSLPHTNRTYWQIHQTSSGQLLGISPLLIEKPNRMPVLLPYLSEHPTSSEQGQQSLQLTGPLLGRVDASSSSLPAIIIEQEAEGWLKLGGSNLSLTHQSYSFFAGEVEHILNQHPAVRASILVGRADEHAGEVPIAYIQLWPDKTAGPKEIYEFALAHVPESRMVPQGIRIVDVLPRQYDGRIDRWSLSNQENAL